MSLCKRSNYTHAQRETPTPCGCDPMTLLSHTVPICHREAQREGMRVGMRGVLREEEVRFRGGGVAPEWWGTGAASNGTEGRKKERKKECVFTVHFQFTLAQMCHLVPKHSLMVSGPPPIQSFIVPQFLHLHNTHFHTDTHTHTLLKNKMYSC